MTVVFIDGQAGTTGLRIADCLATRSEIELITLEDVERKDIGCRRRALQGADIAILCLPDEAAREAVDLADGQTRLLDASSAHRVHNDWVYGLPELDTTRRERIAAAQFVSNPGCYPQGFILLVRPLIDAGLLSADLLLRCNAISGFSGGGRIEIEARREWLPEEIERNGCKAYGLDLQHKHVPEMQHYSGTGSRPIFAPTVAHFYNGMIVNVPLFADELRGADPVAVHSLLNERYDAEPFVRVLPLNNQSAVCGHLPPTGCNGTNWIELMVFGNDEQILLTARYDNLGKGAAGVAVQNLNLMLGVDEWQDL